VDTFEVKKLDATWYYRCESRGIAAVGPGRDSTRKDAVKAAITHAAANPPAEILVYDDNGQSVIIVPAWACRERCRQSNRTLGRLN
jgi:hypothetical protein